MTNQSNQPQEFDQSLSCDASLQDLYGYLDGVLANDATEGIRSHLSACSQCDDVFSFHQHLSSVIGDRCREEMPPELPQRIFGSILGPNNRIGGGLPLDGLSLDFLPNDPDVNESGPLGPTFGLP